MATLGQEPILDSAPTTGKWPKSNDPSIQSPTIPLSSSDELGANAGDRPPSERIAKTLYDGTFWLIAITFFSFGLLLAFTPCVLPMIPILSSILVGEGQPSPLRAFTLSALYVMAMAITYAVMGVMAGLFGAKVQATLQTPCCWADSVFYSSYWHFPCLVSMNCNSPLWQTKLQSAPDRRNLVGGDNGSTLNVHCQSLFARLWLESVDLH